MVELYCDINYTIHENLGKLQLVLVFKYSMSKNQQKKEKVTLMNKNFTDIQRAERYCKSFNNRVQIVASFILSVAFSFESRLMSEYFPNKLSDHISFLFIFL